MATNPLIKQAFGNHDIFRQYLEYLNNPDVIPPFLPVLYRQQACGGPNDFDIIISNARAHHREKNRQVMNEINTQFIVYQQLISCNSINGE